MNKRLKKKLIKLIIFACVLCIVVLAGKFITGQNSVNTGSDDFVAMLDVGQGDSILICSNGEAALIDTGTQMGSRALLTDIRSYGVEELDALILSHSHDDHSGGAEYLLKNIEVENVIVPDFKSDEKVTELNSSISKSGAARYTAVDGMIINVGDFELTVLYSDNSDEDINNRSIILMAAAHGKKFLFTGDAETPLEKDLIEGNINFDCDVLKVGHHGSRTSTSKDFLNIATPEYALISVGVDNSYGHPSKEVVERLEQNGAKVYRTDYEGDIVFSLVNGELVREQ